MNKKKTIWDLHRLTTEEFKQSPKLPIAAVLDNVRSLSNVGAILRTCDAFAAEKVMLCGVTGTPPSPEIHKTALGAEDSVDWQYFTNTSEAIDVLKEAGATICCLEQVIDSLSLEQFTPDFKHGSHYAFVVGNEVDGVDPAIVDRCDICLEIPQLGTKHSLNVAVSAGITMWHFFQHYIKK